MSQKIYTDQLDFDGIKANIKAFLSSQTTFKDYNYEGSALSVLIDVLAYNTHYNALYSNFVANEMFLDSASKYSSAVSLAKTIGYTPRSYRAAQAVIDLSITLLPTETPAVYTLPKGTTFASPVGNIIYLFSTNTDYTAVRDSSGNYVFNNVVLYEGVRSNRTYTVTPTSQFVIPNLNADTTTLIVNVRESGTSSVSDTYTYAQDLLRVKGGDTVYFVKQREDQYYEVYFGNGTIGKSVEIGNVVSLDYIVPSGKEANGLTSFTYFGGNRPDVFYSVTLVSPSFGGDNAETLESIKFNAPKAYTAQNRACTVADYETLIYNNFSTVQSVKVWGGQDNIPKKYGKVFICAKPFSREYLSNDEKVAILDMLEPRKIMTMIPEFVDPDFFRLELSVSAYYNQATAKKTVGELQSLVQSTITAYANSLNVFDSSFRYSKLSGLIDKVDPSMVSNIVNVRVRNPIIPSYSISTNYVANYGNPIYKKVGGGGFFSTKFMEYTQADKCYLIDDGNSNIALMSESDTGFTTFVRNVGTIDYSTGTINISGLNILSLAQAGDFEFVFYPSSFDIIPVRQYIITIPASYVTVNMISDSLAAGDNKANSNHIFTSSR